MIPKGLKQIMSPKTAAVYSLQIIFRTWHKEMITIQLIPPRCGEGAESPSRPKQLGFPGQSTKEMRAAQREESSFSTQLSIDQYVCRKLHETGGSTA